MRKSAPIAMQKEIAVQLWKHNFTLEQGKAWLTPDVCSYTMLLQVFHICRKKGIPKHTPDHYPNLVMLRNKAAETARINGDMTISIDD